MDVQLSAMDVQTAVRTGVESRRSRLLLSSGGLVCGVEQQTNCHMSCQAGLIAERRSDVWRWSAPMRATASVGSIAAHNSFAESSA